VTEARARTRTPSSRAIGITKSNACPDHSFFAALVTTACDWKISDLGWMYTLFFVVLGLSALRC
jgi:hypothetical protein